MTHFSADKDDLYTTVFNELKHMGIKVPKVKKFKSNILKQEKTTQPSKCRIFGVSLADQEWIADCEYVLPKFIVSSVTYLRQHSSKVGLFRKAGSNVRQRELRLKLEKGEDICGSEPNDVASILKQWLRELPEPLIPQYMHDLFIKCQQLDNDENKITALLLTCLLLPPNHLHTLKYLLCFLADFSANSDENMMGSYNLALCMAPNIFVSNDSADKSSANLVHIHVSIIQLLIENAMKIGGVPEFVTFHHTFQEGKSCSELDSSGDFLDVVSSKRKKQKNGHVQDLLSGIKKLVGQNSANGTNAKTPEKYWNSHATAPRQPRLSTGPENIPLNTTPKDKGILNFGTVARSGGHIRKKSFGLLRRKERKRQKSCHGNPLPTVTFNIMSPKNQSEETSSSNFVAKATEESITSASNKNTKLSKSESIKKSASESYLTPKYGKPHRFSLSSPKTSEARLEVPAYFLRTFKTNGNKQQAVQQVEATCPEVKDKNNDCGNVASFKNVEIQNTEIVAQPAAEEKKPPIEHSIGEIPNDLNLLTETETPFRPKVQELKNGGACKKVSHKGSDTQKTGSRGISNFGKRASSSELRSKRRAKSPVKYTRNSKIDLRSISDSQIKQGSHRSVRKSPNFDKSSHRAGLSRNEAFIVKPKRQRKNSLGNVSDESRRSSKKGSSRPSKNEVNALQKSKSLNSEAGDKNKVGKSRRATRNGSLMRGKPNTVKTGLRSELRGNDSILIPSESLVKRKSLKGNRNAIVETNQSSNSEVNQVSKRGNESESREKKRSVKMSKKNEISETNQSYNPVEINKENKKYNDSVLVASEARKDITMNKTKSENVDMNESYINGENKVSDKNNTSLSTKFENFHLSSPVNSTETLIDFINSMFTLDDKPSSSQQQPNVHNLSVDQNRISTRLSMDRHRRSSLQLPKDRGSLGRPSSTQEQSDVHNLSVDQTRISSRLSIDKHRRSSLQLTSDRSSSGSKIPRLRNSAETKRTSSVSEETPETKRKISMSRGSDSSNVGSKIPTKIPDISFDISGLQIGLNDSCFKTPNNIPTSNSINWVSGSKYLGFNSPDDEDTFNKRESIALILKNNPGHVQAKVSMYDTRVRESVVCTRSVPTFSTPLEYMDNKREQRSLQRSHKKLQDTRSYDSAENMNRRRNKSRSPFPLPPKFNIADTSTPSAPVPKPLHMEIDNESLNFVKEVSFNNENCFSKTSSENIGHALKELPKPHLVLNESENSFNLSFKNESNISKRSMENASHPLKEVTNISFEMKSPLIKDGYILQENVMSSGKRQKKPKRSSFNAKSPQKRSKRVSRSESSPGCQRPHDRAFNRIKNSSRSASIILERNTLK